MKVEARAVGRVDFDRIEAVHDGEVVGARRRRPVAGHFQATLEVTVAVRDPGWIALRIPLTTQKNELGHPLFAHTSAVYVDIAGRPRFRAAEAGPLQEDVERALETIKARGSFADDSEREGLLGVYRRALERLDRLRGGERSSDRGTHSRRW